MSSDVLVKMSSKGDKGKAIYSFYIYTYIVVLFKPGRCFFINDNTNSSPLSIAYRIVDSFFMGVPTLVICITTINYRTPRHTGIQVIKF